MSDINLNAKVDTNADKAAEAIDKFNKSLQEFVKIGAEAGAIAQEIKSSFKGVGAASSFKGVKEGAKKAGTAIKNSIGAELTDAQAKMDQLKKFGKANVLTTNRTSSSVKDTATSDGVRREEITLIEKMDTVGRKILVTQKKINGELVSETAVIKDNLAQREKASKSKVEADAREEAKKLNAIFKERVALKKAADKEIASKIATQKIADQKEFNEHLKNEKRLKKEAKKESDKKIATQKTSDQKELNDHIKKEIALKKKSSAESKRQAELVRDINNTANRRTLSKDSQFTGLVKAVSDARKLNKEFKVNKGQLAAIDKLARRYGISTGQVISKLKGATAQTKKLKAGSQSVLISWQSILRQFVGGGIVNSMRRMGATLQDSVISAAKVSKSIAEIQAIDVDLGGFREGANAIREQSRALSDTFAGDINDQIEATYQAISNGSVTAANSLEFLTQANRLATAGLSTTTESVNLLSSVLNSYGLDVSEAERVSAVFFKGVQKGRFRIGEIANTIGRTTALANQLGVQFDEVAGALAVLTKNGVKQNTAQTLLRSIFQKSLKPTEAFRDVLNGMGRGFDTAREAISELGLAQFLKEIALASKGSEDIAKIFSTARAIQGVSILTSSVEELEAFVTEARNGSDALDLLETGVAGIAQSTGRQFQQLQESVSNVFTEDIGKSLLEVLKEISTSAGGKPFDLILDSVKALASGLQTLAGGFNSFGPTFRNAVEAGAALAKSFERNADGLGKLLKAFVLIIPPIYVFSKALTLAGLSGATLVASGKKLGALSILSKAFWVQATSSVRTFGVALYTALGPVGAVLAVIGVLTASVIALDAAFGSTNDSVLTLSQSIDKGLKEGSERGVIALKRLEKSANDLANRGFKPLIGVVARVFTDISKRVRESAVEYQKSNVLFANTTSKIVKNFTDLADKSKSKIEELKKEIASITELQADIARNGVGGLDEVQTLDFEIKLKRAKDFGLFGKQVDLIGDELDRLSDERVRLISDGDIKGAKVITDRLLSLAKSRFSIKEDFLGFANAGAIAERKAFQASEIAFRDKLKGKLEAQLVAQQKLNDLQVKAATIAKLNEKDLLAFDPASLRGLGREEVSTGFIKQIDRLANLLGDEGAPFSKAVKDLLNAEGPERIQKTDDAGNPLFDKRGGKVFSESELDFAKRLAEYQTARDLTLQTQVKGLKGLDVEKLDNSSQEVIKRILGINKQYIDNQELLSQTTLNTLAATIKGEQQKLKALNEESEGRKKLQIALFKSTIDIIKTKPNLEQVALRRDSTGLPGFQDGGTENVNALRDSFKESFNRGIEKLLAGTASEADRDSLRKLLLRITEGNALSNADDSSVNRFFNRNNTLTGEQQIAVQGLLADISRQSSAYKADLEVSKARIAVEEKLNSLTTIFKETTSGMIDGQGKLVVSTKETTKIINDLKTAFFGLSGVTDDLKDAISNLGDPERIRSTLQRRGVELKSRGGVAGGVGAKYLASGGLANHPGGPKGTDTVPAWLTPGEFVINKKNSKKFYSQLQAINAGRQPVYRAGGGSVTDVGGITVTVNESTSANATAKELVKQINRGLRTGAIKLGK